MYPVKYCDMSADFAPVAASCATADADAAINYIVEFCAKANERGISHAITATDVISGIEFFNAHEHCTFDSSRSEDIALLICHIRTQQEQESTVAQSIVEQMVDSSTKKFVVDESSKCQRAVTADDVRAGIKYFNANSCGLIFDSSRSFDVVLLAYYVRQQQQEQAI